MTNNRQYLMPPPQMDCSRLLLLNQLYNPGTVLALRQFGLTFGMHVLEIGCGTGHMACELAQIVGSHGSVVAVDLHEEQLVRARDRVYKAGLKNIEFISLDLNKFNMSLITSQRKFDFIFGRWALEFTQYPQQIIEYLVKMLRPGGMFVYESNNMDAPGFLSFPTERIVEIFEKYAKKIYQTNNMSMHFINDIYRYLKRIGINNINMAINHPSLCAKQEKTCFRLAFEASRPYLLRQDLLSEGEFKDIINDFYLFENADTIARYYRNILIAAAVF